MTDTRKALEIIEARLLGELQNGNSLFFTELEKRVSEQLEKDPTEGLTNIRDLLNQTVNMMMRDEG